MAKIEPLDAHPEPALCPRCGDAHRVDVDVCTSDWPRAGAPPEAGPPGVAAPHPSPSATPPPFPGGDAPALPPAPSGGFRTLAADPPLPPDRPRRLTFLLLLALIGGYLLLGGGGAGVSGAALERAGLLDPTVLSHPEQAWRLVHATFVHANPFVLMVAGFLVWFGGGEAERRGGSGLLLAGVVGAAAALNALRVVVEPAATLRELSGAWPAGCALAAAAGVLARRRGEGAARLVAVLGFDVALLAFLAFSAGALQEVLVVVGAALGMGVGLGAIWPQGEGRVGAGCLAALVAPGLLIGAEAQRRASGGAAPLPPPWEVPAVDEVAPVAPETELRPVDLPRLRVSLDLPSGWKQQPTRRDCPACGEEVTFEPARGEAPEERPCPACGEAVEAPKDQRQAQFVEGSLLSFGLARQLVVWTAPRGPYDAPDTLATRLIADLGGPSSFLRQARLVDEGPFRSEGLGAGYLVSLRGALGGGQQVALRLYVFVGEGRTVLVRSLASASDGAADARDAALFDAVARSLRAHGEKRR